ncbi:MAG: hypothetical protein E7670_08325 [Ruminococcaceae bacterium]|nr:hypothetical protein [Oscillospiraceae bacterium]
MNNKKCNSFLWISLAFSIISTIFIISMLIVSYNQAISNININNDTQLRVGYEESLIFTIFVILSSFVLELSCIRSIYKILKHKPIGYVKICYIISSLLAFLVIVFIHLVLFGSIHLASSSGRDYTADVLLLTPWSSFIVSFVLGSIPVKHDDR